MTSNTRGSETATDTPDELSVIHSIAAEPPNNGADRSGALMDSQQ